MSDPEMKGRSAINAGYGLPGNNEGVEVDGCITQESNQPAPPKSASNPLQDLSGQARSVYVMCCHAQAASRMPYVRELSRHADDRERRRKRVIQGLRTGTPRRDVQCR